MRPSSPAKAGLLTCCVPKMQVVSPRLSNSYPQLLRSPLGWEGTELGFPLHAALLRALPRPLVVRVLIADVARAKLED